MLFFVCLLVSDLKFIVSLRKWVFVNPDCSEHSAITEKALIGVLRTKPFRR